MTSDDWTPTWGMRVEDSEGQESLVRGWDRNNRTLWLEHPTGHLYEDSKLYYRPVAPSQFDTLTHAIRIALEDPFTELTSEVRSILTDALNPSQERAEP